MSTDLAIAFGAGMVATVNPCGFAMLPAYLSYFMGIQDEGRTRSSVIRSALIVGAVVSFGFLVVFGVAGALISALSATVASNWLPWLALAIGIGLVILGIAMLRGYEMRVGLPKAGRASTVRSYRNIFAFGTSYAVASLSCALPVFLIVVANQFTRNSFGGSLLIFAAYAAGMSVVLLSLTVVLALGKRSLVNRLRSAGGYINRVSGALLVVAGLWISWFWITSLSSGAASLGTSPTFQFVEDLSQTITNFVGDNKLAVGVVLTALVGVAVAVAVRGGAAETRADEADNSTDAVADGTEPESQTDLTSPAGVSG